MIYTPINNLTPNSFQEIFYKSYRDYMGYRFDKHHYNVYLLPRVWSLSACLFHTPLQDTDIVLEVGGCCSYFMHYVAQFVKQAYNVDPNTGPTGAEWERSLVDFTDAPNLTWIKDSAAKLPFPDNYFDKIYTISTLEHCYPGGEDFMIIDEVKRTLKVGGIFTGTVDFNPCTEIPLGIESPCRTYTLASLYEKIIDRSGMVLAGGDYNKYEPIPDKVDWIATEIFFKLIKL